MGKGTDERGLGDDILAGLNTPQREAVLANDGPLLVLAGAGSGKTRVITRKVAWLVRQEGYRPWEILAVTFTNKAAAEMRERCRQLLGDAAEDLWLGTFHRIGVRVLRQHGPLVGVDPHFGIYDQADQRAMLGRCIEELGLSTSAVDAKTMQGFIDRAKQRGFGPDELGRHERLGASDPRLAVFRRYEMRMREAKALDFGDLLSLPLRIVREHALVASEYKQRWRYILVDEFQDTNHVQYEFLKAVLGDERRICVVGDDDQSIYRWRGAEVANILGFAEDFEGARVVRLEQNYRSSANILSVAGSLIARNTGRHDKTLWTERDGGPPVRVHAAATDQAEADYVVRRIHDLRVEHPLREIAIFYRTHAQSRVFEDALRRARVPYVVVGGLRFYERAEVKDVLAYLRAAVNPADAIALERIINTPTRGIGAKTVEAIRHDALDRQTSFWEACRHMSTAGTNAQQKKLRPFVALMERLMALAAEASALQVVGAVLDETRMVAHLKADGSPEAEARVENIKELANAISEHAQSTGDARLEGFLEQVALVAAVDNAELGSDAVVMMSAHNAKGLEYDVVFVTGLEDGLFPHFNSAEEEGGTEEERRLAYVACTRARHVLHLTYAELRRRFGTTLPTMVSPFLRDLPAGAIREDDAGRHVTRFHDGFAPRVAPRPVRRPAAAPQPEPSFTHAMPDYESFSQDEVRLGPGSRVFHPSFGEGTVAELSGAGSEAILRVRFAAGLEKRILARYLTPA
ncbi:MAG: UvrD-helicase domain-containing protein [Deltaproteobacteria bacterium]|nr:UvrD-helicase domain-containing protein [Deltaproteobacteria bacterium]MCB9785214.1 UvrD-helicase domain-containing protein [Deltaproteobacteria bacterium]